MIKKGVSYVYLQFLIVNWVFKEEKIRSKMPLTPLIKVEGFILQHGTDVIVETILLDMLYIAETNLRDTQHILEGQSLWHVEIAKTYCLRRP